MVLSSTGGGNYMQTEKQLRVLNISDYNLIANKDPKGSYDRKTRENLYRIIRFLAEFPQEHGPLETRVFHKFHNAQFTALDKKDKEVRIALARYRLNSGIKRVIKWTATYVSLTLLISVGIYQIILDTKSRQSVDVVLYSGLNRIGLVSADQLVEIRQDLDQTASELKRFQKDNQELSQALDQIALNNRVTENLKYVVRHIYNNPRARYVKFGNETALLFNDREIVRYRSDPNLWYLLGVIDSGVIRVYYNDEEVFEIEAIFGRTGEETPIGEYQIVNKVHKPTWYKKERVNDRVRVRAIPFGDPDHEIGTWWMGLKKLDALKPTSYGLHGVNANKVNEFYKKNFDWRNGSAGCPNIQAWYLEFLARMVPKNTRVTIVQQDKWKKGLAIASASPSSA